VGTPPARVRRRECHPGGRGFLFAPTSTAFLLSEDNTETWTNIMNSRLPTTRTQSVFRSLDGGRPLAGHQQWPDVAQHGPKRSGNHRSYESADPLGGGGIFKSLDGGAHLFAVNSGLGNLAVLCTGLPWTRTTLPSCTRLRHYLQNGC